MAAASFTYAAACPAISLTSTAYKKVITCKFMTSQAVRSRPAARMKRCSPFAILRSGHCFKMVRIDASPVATQVIDLKAVTDWAAKCLVRQPVRQVAPTPNRERAVPLRVYRSGPEPAFTLDRDTLHEANLDRPNVKLPHAARPCSADMIIGSRAANVDADGFQSSASASRKVLRCNPAINASLCLDIPGCFRVSRTRLMMS